MHYQRYRDHDYLGAWDFEDGDRTVTIDRVEQGLIDRQDGTAPERVPLMYLRELDRPMVLNATNGAFIAAMYGSPDTRDWEGKRVTLTRGMTTNKQGQPCFGIRVVPRRPPELEPEETEAERIARLEAELARARAGRVGGPAELPPRNPAARTVETITSADVAVIDAADKEIRHAAGR